MTPQSLLVSWLLFGSFVQPADALQAQTLSFSVEPVRVASGVATAALLPIPSYPWNFVRRASAVTRPVDDFDLYTNSVLARVPSSPAATAVDQISTGQLFQSKPIIGRENGCLLVVHTDEGNWARLIVTPSFRKHSDGEVPLVLVQRFQCIRPGSENGRLAAGKDIYLFDGFQFNLDLGQVVPEGGGGDIVFVRDGSGGQLRTVGRAKMYRVNRPLVEPVAGPSARPGPVSADDFAGSFRLMANGKWSGMLTLKVTGSGEISGSYVSDQTGADYPVRGSLLRPAHHVKFTIELPMVLQEFDGFMWTQGKNVIAGTTALEGNTFGFVAIRDGTELRPADAK